MTTGTASVGTRILDRLFPRMPDFYGLFDEQCALVVEAMGVFVEFMRCGDEASAKRVRALEHAADRLKARNLDVLHRSFATPIDREDIYQAVAAIDDILNYAKTTVREMQALGVAPDAHTLAMTLELRAGAEALQRGFGKLAADPGGAEVDAEAARKSERRTEKIYRKAIAELFDPQRYLEHETEVSKAAGERALGVLLEPLGAQSAAVGAALGFVVEILKRREVYRHLSNAADRVARAGEVLHDIVVKNS